MLAVLVPGRNPSPVSLVNHICLHDSISTASRRTPYKAWHGEMVTFDMREDVVVQHVPEGWNHTMDDF